MTDEELIRRLRDAPADNRGNKNRCLDAADRIEALMRDLGLADDQRSEWERHCKAAEANLTKAVGALQKIAYGGAYTDMQIARAVLAEIGGGA